MTAFPVRAASAALLAGLFLQACVSTPPQRDASPAPTIQLEQRPTDAASAAESQDGREMRAEPPAVAASLLAIPTQVTAKLQRAQALEAEAANLASQAQMQERLAGSFDGGSGGSGGFLGNLRDCKRIN
jgi:hypothetical protein